MIQSIHIARFGQGWETESPTTFGEWLSQSRKGLRLTRDELARRVGCSVSALRKFEDGQRRPSAQIAELLANSLGVPPSDRAIFVRVARGELGVARLPGPALSNPSPAPSAARANLPVPATPVIGRQRELAELERLLGDPQCRLLGLVGPGGIGKTRLAIEAASQAQGHFPDGVYFIPLVSINSARFIVPVVANAIGFSFQAKPEADLVKQLLGYLREKQSLLVLDNLEHLLSNPGMEVLTDLLAAAPRVKLMVTSREAPGLSGQWLYDVQGLPIPENGSTEGSAENTAVELFLQRARRAHVGFSPTAAEYPAIVRICRLLGGTPLAVELAAAWVRTLSCEEIAQEIERGLDFLRVSTGEFAPRHRSLRSVFDHSWKLLADEERLVLVRLSVFQGGFRREAGEQVAHATLPILNTLVSKSLLRRSEVGRYDLHELIRQFAAEQCADCQDEQAQARARHGRYFLKFFAQADARLRSTHQQETLTELTAEMGNFRLAWDWAVMHGEFALIEATLRPFILLYDTRSWYQDGIDALGSAIEALETAHGSSPIDRMNQVALGHLLTERALLTYRLGHHQPAQEMLERCLEILRPLEVPAIAAEAMSFLGTVLNLTGQYVAAAEILEEGRTKSLEARDAWVAALCLSLLGSVAMNLGEYGVAYERHRDAVEEWRAIGDPRFTAFALNHLGQTALRLARYDEAQLVLEESVELNLSVGARWNLGHAYQGLGDVAQARGQHAQAIQMLSEGVRTFTELGGQFYLAQIRSDMGRSHLALGAYAEAERAWREALRIAMEIHGAPVALDALLGLASLRARNGDLEQALEMLWVVLDHPSSSHDTLERAAVFRIEVEAQLTPGQVESMMKRASNKTLEQVTRGLFQDGWRG